jgi:murein DD-endopeptidase MepM/ murein hydrolase activator NlpD
MIWTWPLPGLDCEIPNNKDHQGSFGSIRKHDIHTGVDLYCDEGQVVVSVEDGMVSCVEDFTGPIAGTPWWNDTKAVWVIGTSGVVVYGEIEPENNIKRGELVRAGDIIGRVKRVLKVDKGLPMDMLHIELYRHGMKETAVWNHDSEIPEFLLNPTENLNISKQNC